jgi:phosphoglycolate phosphatase-like HAD superfamily hydrolase
MNLIGKIFTVLIFVMSIFFMTMAIMVYSTHKNWRDIVLKPQSGLQSQVKTLRAEKEELTSNKDKLQRELDELKSAKQKELAALENEISLKKNEIDQREKEQAKLKQSERDAVAALTVTQAEAKKAREEVEGLRSKEEQAQADRDKHFKEMQRLTDELHDKVNELTTLKARSQTLAADLAKATETLRRFKLDPKIDYSDKQPPDVSGLVLAVRNGGYVEISIGADSGLRKGHSLEVYRTTSSGSSYVGRINVTETTPDRAVCKVDPKFQQSDIKNGDSVTSKLDR